jgi:hypothetical protein
MRLSQLPAAQQTQAIDRLMTKHKPLLAFVQLHTMDAQIKSEGSSMSFTVMIPKDVRPERPSEVDFCERAERHTIYAMPVEDEGDCWSIKIRDRWGS